MYSGHRAGEQLIKMTGKGFLPFYSWRILFKIKLKSARSDIVRTKIKSAKSFFSFSTSFIENTAPATEISRLPKNFITEEMLLFFILLIIRKSAAIPRSVRIVIV